MAHAHHKILLSSIDRRHAGTKARSVHLIALLHPVHPGMDHLMAQRAERGLQRQGLKQRARQHDLADRDAMAIPAEAVQTGAAPHAAVAPAHRNKRLALGIGKVARKVLPVQTVKQRQQGNQRQTRCSTAWPVWC